MDIKSVINAIHSPESHPQRNGFDLSHRKVFTAKAGELLPVLCEELVPEDYFEIDTAALVRTLMPLQTAAFIRAKVHFDFFFVPMTSIWRNFDAFYYQRADNYTSYKQGSAYEPNIKLEDLVDLMCGGSNNATLGVRDSVDCRMKLLQLLGYGYWNGKTPSDFQSGGQLEALGSKSLTTLPLHAYNRIYNLIYRNAWLDEPQSSDIKAMSADFVKCNTYLNSLEDRTGLLSGNGNPDLLQMHYHQYHQDLFQGLLPSQQFGAVVTFPSSDNTIRILSDITKSSVGSVGVSTTSLANSQLTLLDSNNSQISNAFRFSLYPENGFDVISLRKALAMQSWKELNARAGWKAGMQQKAMFGVGEASDRVHDVEYIDSVQFPIMIDEVVQSSPSTAISGLTSSASAVGELGGKAIGVGNGHKIKFSSGNRWGYLMCIAYIVPESEYDAQGIDKMVVRSEPDNHYMPKFANLGLEPVFKWELNALGNPSVVDSTLGFSTRNHEYKTRQDKVYGNVQSGKNLQIWCAVRRDLQGIVNLGSIPTSHLYINPSVLDTVFYSQSTGSLDTDQFLINLNFGIKAVRPMPELGLPSMNF